MDARVEKYLVKLMVDRSGDIRHELRWADELELLEIIKNGRTDLIDRKLAASRERYDQTIEDVNLSPSKQEMRIYQLISALTLFSRAAIEGGVPEVLAFSMMESYMFCASKYGGDYFLDALYSFTHAVSEHRLSDEGDPPQINRIKSFVMENLNNPIDLRSISELLHLSPSRCSHLFREKTGMTIRQFIEKQRIAAACAYLYYTDKTVSGLSEYLVFSNPSHFASVFKKHTGMTPNEWRKEMRGRAR